MLKGIGINTITLPFDASHGPQADENASWNERYTNTTCFRQSNSFAVIKFFRLEEKFVQEEEEEEE